MRPQQNYPKFKNLNQEGAYLTKELGFSNVTAHNIICLKKAVLKRMAEAEALADNLWGDNNEKY